MFDAEAYREAHQPWMFKVGGRLYVARHVSAGQVAAYFRAEETKEASVIARALRKLLRTAFPWRPSFVWRGDPVTLLTERLPFAERRAAILDFFESLGVIATKATPPRKTPGTNSPG